MKYEEIWPGDHEDPLEAGIRDWCLSRIAKNPGGDIGPSIMTCLLRDIVGGLQEEVQKTETQYTHILKTLILVKQDAETLGIAMRQAA